MKNYIRKQRNRKLLALAVILLAGILPATGISAQAATSTIDVTVSTIPGTSSPDPYTYWTTKDDNENEFVYNIHTISSANSISLRAYKQNVGVVSADYTVSKNDSDNALNTNHYKPYNNNCAEAKKRYRLYFYCTEANYVMVNATGKYTP